MASDERTHTFCSPVDTSDKKIRDKPILGRKMSEAKIGRHHADVPVKEAAASVGGLRELCQGEPALQALCKERVAHFIIHDRILD